MRYLFGLLLLVAGPACADTCWITPFDGVKQDSDNREMQVANYATQGGSKITVITVTTVTATEQSSAMPSGTQVARLVCDIQVYYAVGTNPTATTSDNYLPADTIEYLGIDAGYEIALCDADCT